MIGAGRMYEAACVLSFDKNLFPTINQTIIVSPYSWVTLKKEFELFEVDCNSFIFYSDSEIIKKFNLEAWVVDHWYLQQGIKLSLIDSIDGDFLIQDCDVFAIRPYKYFFDNCPVFRVEELWNHYQHVYASKVKELVGLERTIPYSFVTEFMPYCKDDWQFCKKTIEERNNKSWQDAILTLAPFDDTKWLSEYELLGIYKTNKDKNYQLIVEKYPEINSLQDFEQTNWQVTDTVKFKARPFKYMGQSTALTIKNFFNRKENGVYSN